MNNRVDYLSDRLVNLRGKHKSVDEVIPPDSIANGVSIPSEPAAKKTANAPVSQAALAQERRRQQTVQLYTDFEQRLVRRSRQTELQYSELAAKIEKLKALQQKLTDYQQMLSAGKLSEDTELTPSQLGERYRELDRTRLDFFQTEAELEHLLNSQTASAMPENIPAAPESFSVMLKKGAAMALTIGAVIALAVVIAAAMLCAAWS